MNWTFRASGKVDARSDTYSASVEANGGCLTISQGTRAPLPKGQATCNLSPEAAVELGRFLVAWGKARQAEHAPDNGEDR